MKKADLIQKVQSHMLLIDDRDVSKTDVEAMLRALETTVHDELRSDGEVTLPGIGKFSVKKRAARTGRNPQTGQPMEIAAASVPAFSASKALKDSTR